MEKILTGATSQRRYFTFYTTALNTRYIKEELEIMTKLNYYMSMRAEWIEEKGDYFTLVYGTFSEKLEGEIINTLEDIKSYMIGEYQIK